jgi:hypothetical protein
VVVLMLLQLLIPNGSIEHAPSSAPAFYAPSSTPAFYAPSSAPAFYAPTTPCTDAHTTYGVAGRFQPWPQTTSHLYTQHTHTYASH